MSFDYVILQHIFQFEHIFDFLMIQFMIQAKVVFRQGLFCIIFFILLSFGFNYSSQKLTISIYQFNQVKV